MTQTVVSGAGQKSLSDYERMSPKFARDRALIMRFLHDEKKRCLREKKRFRGLRYAQLRKMFLASEGTVPTVGNRARELRDSGWVELIEEEDGYIHVYPKETQT